MEGEIVGSERNLQAGDSKTMRAKHFFPTILLATAALPFMRPVSAAAKSPKPEAITIDSSVTIVESPNESEPVRRATQDLMSDFAKVFGREPARADDLEDAGSLAILIAERDHLHPGINCATTTDPESFAFSVIRVPGHQPLKHIVCLTGADMRGTIYAIYQFSQSILGVDPMYLWTDKQPEKRTSITLPRISPRRYPKPVFRYRGFFINDEDLLTGWIPAPKSEQTGIALRVWDNVFETILRLKGNMVVPGTWIFPRRRAGARGRGARPDRQSASRHPAGRERGALAQGCALQLLHASGDSGARVDQCGGRVQARRRDSVERGAARPVGPELCALDPSVRGNDALLGKRISDAIAVQMKIVRARYPKAQFVTDLWQEGARLMDEGYLKIPPEVTLVWADTGYGDMQDGGKVAAGQGMYIHVAMMNGQANQLSELVPVGVIQEELGRYIKAGATSYVLVNTSDIRPVAMTARALMETAWGGVPAQLAGADDAYYHRWAAEEFGAKSADAIAQSLQGVFRRAGGPRAQFACQG